MSTRTKNSAGLHERRSSQSAFDILKNPLLQNPKHAPDALPTLRNLKQARSYVS